MKKIDTTSARYNKIRDILNTASFLGGAGAIDCALIPWIEAVFEKKFRFMRPLCLLGTYGLSIAGGSVAASAIDQYIDECVDAWNQAVDKKNRNDHFDTNDIPPTYSVPTVETFKSQNLVDQIAESGLFEFDSEEEAKNVCEHCADWLNRHGKLTINDVDGIRWLESTKHVCHVYTDGDMYGWTKITGEIEQFGPNKWYLDFGPYDIQPNYYKSSAMNDADLVKNDKED